ncbi:DinB family protein [Chitinophaga qingshengii]|uniref:DinB family protein n=1 Tax=Chitinophaga qingshengii TaxID=1569794 RepID=A0ABR7TMZ4_9BACT|nr:DinB family protein [Chitinophaga qingshengii]MBC9931853.1 DinB family protein [Chitinophaga qingshengii]
MLQTHKDSLWKQFGASIDMLINAVSAYPENLWYTEKKFFYISYHVAVFLDYYLTIPAGPPASPLPFTLTEDIPEDAIDDIIPDRIYSQDEILSYLQASRKKCHDLLFNMTENDFTQSWVEVEGNKVMPVFELFLYNMRHVQHHAAQLNMLLRKDTGDAPRWVRAAK